MVWGEFESLVVALASKITSYFGNGEGKINVISPLLRTGGIVGGMLAVKMRVIPMLPVQFKYSYRPTLTKQIFSVPELLGDLPDPMSVLLCEGNTSTGNAAVKAAEVIKAKYPQAKIYLATLTKVYGGPERLDGIEKIFYGALADERFKASDEERNKLGIRRGITIFPWENIDDELADINST